MSSLRFCVASLGSLALSLTAASALADDITILPTRSGAISAWLGTESALPAIHQNMERGEVQAVDSTLTVGLGADIGSSRKLRLLASSDERFDLKRALRPDRQATLAAVLRAREASQLYLLVNTDDGIAVTLDQSTLYLRDKSRPRGLDDDVIPLALTPGDHKLVIHLHQKSGEWTFRSRLVDQADGLAPRHVSVLLPQAGATEALELARRLASVDLSLALSARGYAPSVTIRFAGGVPAVERLPVSVHCFVKAKGARTELFRLGLGEIARDSRSVYDFHALLPVISPQEIQEADAGVLACDVDVAGRSVSFERSSSSAARSAIVKLDEVGAKLDSGEKLALLDAAVLRSTVRLARSRLEGFVSSGDPDAAALVEEALFVERLLAPLQRGEDPLAAIRGPARLGYRSALDGNDHPFGIYLPSDYGKTPNKKYPLVVVLHGLNGQPMQMIRWFFGRDDGAHNGYWEDRHWGQLPDLDAIVISPSGFGNLGYRDSGEVDIMSLRDWALRTFAVDPRRVYVTGPSMGGIGSAAVALRYADQWAAAAPLCGYHSFFLRNDMQGRRRRPWEEQQAEYWSNAYWAENGGNLPLLVVHGKKDLPEANSGVLIDRYKRLGYSIEDEHPEAGHDVWQRTYDDFRAFRWLMRYAIDPEPKRVVLKTANLRYSDNHWLSVRKLQRTMDWAEVTATVVAKDRIDLSVRGALALHIERPKSRVDGNVPLQVHVDRSVLEFAASEPIDLHVDNGAWVKGEDKSQQSGLHKGRGLSGPLRDIYLEPLVFVYGTQEPSMARINYEVAKSLSEPPVGVDIKWPVVADTDVDDALVEGHSLFLVGTATSNSYLRTIDAKLPIHVDGDAVVVGDKRFTGNDIGAVFIYPNPRNQHRYVAVASSPTAGGTMRVLGLPRLLPDYAVYSVDSEARGQIVLGNASFVHAGAFDETWGLNDIEPAANIRSRAKN